MAGGLRVLMLDDSPLSLEMVGEVLTAAGFEVVGTSTLDDFQDELDRQAPDVILTDVQMPDVSGDNVCRLLKHLHETKSIPIVLFSTLPAPELATLAERAGADAFVCKREGPSGIVARIKALVEEMVF